MPKPVSWPDRHRSGQVAVCLPVAWPMSELAKWPLAAERARTKPIRISRTAHCMVLSSEVAFGGADGGLFFMPMINSI